MIASRLDWRIAGEAIALEANMPVSTLSEADVARALSVISGKVPDEVVPLIEIDFVRRTVRLERV